MARSLEQNTPLVLGEFINSKFPHYKNITSVRKPDGTKFSTFSQFVDQVIQEKKIPKADQKMLLVNVREKQIQVLKP
ncbi:MAG: hypothetical protein AAFO04_15840 [Cyanobacteria bacterium J06592_8]